MVQLCRATALRLKPHRLLTLVLLLLVLVLLLLLVLLSLFLMCHMCDQQVLHSQL